MLKLGALVNICDDYNENALAYAIQSFKDDVVDHLLDNTDVDINIGNNPLFTAFEHRNDVIAKKLITLGANIFDTTRHYYQNVLMYALKYSRDNDIINMLIDKYNEKNMLNNCNWKKETALNHALL